MLFYIVNVSFHDWFCDNDKHNCYVSTKTGIKKCASRKVFCPLRKLSSSTSIFIPVLFTFQHSITSHSFVDFSLAHALKRQSGNRKAFYHFLWHTFSSLFSVLRKISLILALNESVLSRKKLKLWKIENKGYWKLSKSCKICF